MKSKIAIAVLALSLTAPVLWANETHPAGAAVTPAADGSQSSSTQMHKKHNGGKHHKKMKNSANTMAPAEPTPTPAAQ